jgi:hypothetical protein
VGPLAIPLVVFLLLTETLGHDLGDDPSAVGLVILLALWGGCHALWGRATAKLIDSARVKRMMLAGAVSIAPVIAGFYVLVVWLDREVFTGPPPPTHIGYTLTFVPYTFLVSFAGSFALGLAATGKLRPALRIGALSGLAAAGAFLLINLATDLVGFRVGGKRITALREIPPMPVVTLLGLTAASLAGGGLMGRLLAAVTAEY